MSAPADTLAAVVHLEAALVALERAARSLEAADRAAPGVPGLGRPAASQLGKGRCLRREVDAAAALAVRLARRLEG